MIQLCQRGTHSGPCLVPSRDHSGYLGLVRGEHAPCVNPVLTQRQRVFRHRAVTLRFSPQAGKLRFDFGQVLLRRGRHPRA